MNVNVAQDHANRMLRLQSDIRYSEILAKRDGYLLVQSICHQIADSVTAKVMEKLGPAIDKALAEAFSEKGQS